VTDASAGRWRCSALTWKPCASPAQRGFECATARVPLDYSRPRGAKIRLAVIRHRATDRARRIGALFVNFGGPGASGTDVLPMAYDFFPAALRARFDFVSWDPRGIGRSTAVQCFASQEAENRFLARLPQGFPVGRSERRTWIRLYARSSGSYAISPSGAKYSVPSGRRPSATAGSSPRSGRPAT
jgi:hypothetical protein